MVGLSFGMVIASALSIWKGLSVATGTESPIVVVLSGSMEPGFYRGDLMLLYKNSNSTYTAGDIVVYNLDGKPIPIVHRVMRVHEDSPKDDALILTKGDNNKIDDRGLYPKGMMWLSKDNIVGKVYGTAPYVGMITVVMSDYPQLKAVLIAILGFMVLVNRE